MGQSERWGQMERMMFGFSIGVVFGGLSLFLEFMMIFGAIGAIIGGLIDPKKK